PVAAGEHEVDGDALDDQQAQHRTHRHPQHRPRQRDADEDQCDDGGDRRQNIESQYTPTVSHRIGSSREMSSLPSTSETSSRSVHRTVCGLAAPAFSLTDVATTITVSVRDADADSSGCCWGGGAPFGPGCAWWIDSTATESTCPVVRACNVWTSLRYGSTVASKSAL